ncbi:angio-associated migratory cell protein [Aplysia californica]|uniref:Angio-associated migratory cell protein n=1 Tax=Aplysia californica TaxID=6500 RepID=A0ABM0JRM7_APLCA|nr:angio-associated migratory cell protein [Aplysia californica]
MADFEQEEGDLTIDPSEVIQVIELNDDGDGSGDPSNVNDDSGLSDEDADENEEMDTDEAAAGPVQDDSALTFLGHHNDAVICTEISPVNSHLVITGGQDDQALVWNSRDGSVMFQCTGHTDTVVSVGFSFDGSFVATADMKGMIKVWKVETGTEVWSFEVSDIEWLQWHQAAPVLLVGTKEGQVWMWKIPSGDCKTFVGYGPSALCGRILPDGKRAYVGYDDGAVKVWDLKSTEAVFTVSGHDGHKEPVFCMDHNNDGSLIMSGSGDMTVKIISTVNGKVVATLKCTESDGDEDSVETVGFCKTHEYVATGTLSGNLEIWNLPSKSVRHRCDHPYGIVKLRWSASSPILYTVCLDGCVRQFDGRNGQLMRMWQGHSAGILDFDIARDESFIVTASDDFTAKVFSLADAPR